jgi:hypothetical protein
MIVTYDDYLVLDVDEEDCRPFRISAMRCCLENE